MNEHEITTLLERAGSAWEPDVDRLVTGGAGRGRRRRTRRRVGAVVAAAVLVGAVTVGLSNVDLAPRSDRTNGIDPAGTPTAGADPTPSATTDPDAPRALSLDPEAIRTEIASMLPNGDLGPTLRDPPYGVVSSEDRRLVNFLYQGTLTTFDIEPAMPSRTCQVEADATDGSCSVIDGSEVLTWGPTTGDGVTAQGATAWRHGYEVSVLSYNAADGKDVAPVMADPAIDLDTLTAIVMSGAWYAA